MVATCKQCGSQNRVGEIPRGTLAVCGNCRSVLGQVDNSAPAPPKRRFSPAFWSWAAIIGIGALAFLVDATRDKTPSTKKRPSDVSGTSNYSRSSQAPRPPFSAPLQPLPPHGDVTRLTTEEPIAPLEIRSAPGSYYLVKLSDSRSGRDVLSVFVHGGQTASVDVPLGSYNIKYASGDRWYGTTHLFGPDTAYSKADKAFDFRIEGNQVAGYTLTLYRVRHGNLSTSRISADQF